jgi:2-polyprenyl-3-methyl-5-hydroxy-6-metoxy-1,4-benzoquinol methylase
VTPRPPYACPLDGGELAGDDELHDELHCANGHAFPVRDRIPRFADDAYSSAFGAQWQAFRRTQLDSHTGLPISGDRARRCLGPAWDALAGAQVLECGCGAGRFTEVLLDRDADVTSVDLSSAVVANQENFPQNDRHRVAQADIRRLPFAPRGFDIVFCLGVIQHTPDPEVSIRALYAQVKPGGWLVIDHYTRRLQWLLSSAPAFRAVLKRLPDARGLAATEQLVRALLPLHRRARGPAATVLRRVSPVQAYFDKLPLGDRDQYDWAVLDTHDALRDWFKHFRTPAQIASTLRDLGLVDIAVAVGGNGVEARGRRPEAGPA